VFRRLRRSRGATVGGVILVALVLAAVVAPLLTPYEPLVMNPGDGLQPPSRRHWLGTDVLGRDLFTRILFGARISLQTGLISVSIAIAIGVPMGLLSGFYGGATDRLMMRVVDLMLTFPGILLALVIIAILGPDLFHAMLAVGISASPTYARVVRATVLSAKSQTYVEAARATGCTNLRIMLRHILPNTVASIIVLATLGVAGAIIAAAALSYLGLGAKPPQPNAGKLFIDMFTSRLGLLALAQAGEFVLVPGIYPPIKDADKLRIAMMEDLDEQEIKRFRDEFGKFFVKR